MKHLGTINIKKELQEVCDYVLWAMASVQEVTTGLHCVLRQ